MSSTVSELVESFPAVAVVLGGNCGWRRLRGAAELAGSTEGVDRVDSFVEQAAAFIRSVHGIAPPNEAAGRFILGIAAALERFGETRDLLRFEDEPAGFEAALLATKERHDHTE